MTRLRLRELGLGLALFLIATLPYWGCLGHEFLSWDDRIIILAQPFLRALSLENLATIFSPFAAREEWLPLRDLTLALNFALGGEQAWHFALVGVVLHGLAALAAWACFRELLRRPGWGARAAWVGAALFACHAAHVESVAWLSGRKDPLSLVFLLLALRAWARYRRGASGLGWPLLWFCCALLSKANAFVLPAWLVGYDLLLWRGASPGSASPANARAEAATSCAPAAAGPAPWFWATRSWAERFLPVAPFALIGLGFVKLYVTMTARDGVLEGYPAGGLATVLRTDAVLLLDYLRYYLVPLEHQAIYEVEFRTGFDGAVLASLALLLALGALACTQWRRRPLVTFAAGLAATSMVPYLNLIPHGIYFAERYTYLPSLAAALVLGARWARAWRHHGTHLRALLVLGLAAWLGAHALLSAQRAARWRDDATFWRYQASQLPGNPAPDFNLAESYEQAGRYEEARALYAPWAEERPGGGLVVAAIYRLGRVARREGRLEEAIAHYERYARLRPDEGPVHNNLAEAYLASGRPAEASQTLRRFLARRPGYLRGRRTLAVVLERQGDAAGAAAEWEEIIRRARLEPEQRLAAEARQRLARLREGPAPR